MGFFSTSYWAKIKIVFIFSIPSLVVTFQRTEMKSFMGSYTLFLHFQQFNDELQLNYSVDKFNSSFVQTVL